MQVNGVPAIFGGGGDGGLETVGGVGGGGGGGCDGGKTGGGDGGFGGAGCPLLGIFVTVYTGLPQQCTQSNLPSLQSSASHN